MSLRHNVLQLHSSPWRDGTERLTVSDSRRAIRLAAVVVACFLTAFGCTASVGALMGGGW